jgi:tight adherence protein C
LTQQQAALFWGLMAVAVLLATAAFVVLSREESLRNLRVRVRYVASQPAR